MNTAERFRAAAEVAAKLIEDGYTEVSVGMEQHNLSTIVFNTVTGDSNPDMLKKASLTPVVSIKVKASREF